MQHKWIKRVCSEGILTHKKKSKKQKSAVDSSSCLDSSSNNNNNSNDDDGIAFVPEAGAILMHMHGDRCLEHEAEPVLRGVKYILRTDIVYGNVRQKAFDEWMIEMIEMTIQFK